MTLLSCGNRNSQTQNIEIYRSTKPINSTTCECYDYFGVECTAWCTSAAMDFELAFVRSKGSFNVTCPKQKKVLGCHISPTVQQNGAAERWRSFYPSLDGYSCSCYDYFGATCLATCATNIRNYEILAVQDAGNVTSTCKGLDSKVLGCGKQTFPTSRAEYYPVASVLTDTSCVCYDFFNTKCFAICGSIV